MISIVISDEPTSSFDLTFDFDVPHAMRFVVHRVLLVLHQSVSMSMAHFSDEVVSWPRVHQQSPIN